MKADSCVTVWSLKENPDAPPRKVFRKVYVDFSDKISKNGIKQRGFFNASTMTVRIPTEAEIGVFSGDYLCIGECLDQFPSFENALKITEVKDNRRGSQKHWRISCGG